MNTNHIIFVIEDSPIISELLAHVLTREIGAKVLVFDSCESALSIMKKASPDLILLDYNLNSRNSSNMTGKLFLTKMSEFGHKAPVIMISGQRDKMVSIDALQEGAVDYIDKNDETFMEDVLDSAIRILEVRELKKNESNISKLVPDHLRKGLILFAILSTAILITFWL